MNAIIIVIIIIMGDFQFVDIAEELTVSCSQLKDCESIILNITCVMKNQRHDLQTVGEIIVSRWVVVMTM